MWKLVENINSLELIQEFHEANPEAMRTLKVEKDINPTLDPQPSSSPSFMDFSLVQDFTLDLDLNSINIDNESYAAFLLTSLQP
jgi:hypothetical protein